MALILRCQKNLFCAYRTDQYADPEGFMVSLGVVLEGFPDEVITHVTDPRTGIQRRMKWPPTISEVIEACEEHQDYLRKLRMAKPAYRVPPTEGPRGPCVQIFVPVGHARYEGLVRWAKDQDAKWWRFGKSSDGRDGIWVPFAQWESPEQKRA